MKSRYDYQQEINSALRGKIDLFVENFNGIRAGPELKLKEFEGIRTQYQIEQTLFWSLVNHLENLTKLGYPKEDIKKLQTTVEFQKAKFIGWAQDKYGAWKAFWEKLKEVKESEEKEKKRKFGL